MSELCATLCDSSTQTLSKSIIIIIIFSAFHLPTFFLVCHLLCATETITSIVQKQISFLQSFFIAIFFSFAAFHYILIIYTCNWDFIVNFYQKFLTKLFKNQILSYIHIKIEKRGNTICLNCASFFFVSLNLILTPWSCDSLN